MTWNNRKVIIRAVISSLAGTTALESSSGRPVSRLEVGFESKNTMTTGNANPQWARTLDQNSPNPFH